VPDIGLFSVVSEMTSSWAFSGMVARSPFRFPARSSPKIITQPASFDDDPATSAMRDNL
jgi:hypothetical protein